MGAKCNLHCGTVLRKQPHGAVDKPTLVGVDDSEGLARRCARYLEEAEKRIELLTRDESGLLKTEPLTWDEGASQ